MKQLFAISEHSFTPDELDAIIMLGDQLIAEQGPQPTAEVAGYRSCKIGWIEISNLEAWIYGRMADVGFDINAAFFKFELRNIAENLQYTVYEEGSHFGWHIDQRPGTIAPRKLSLTLQLSNLNDYDGGDLQVRTDERVRYVPATRGTLIAFPSWLSHRVTPVTRGVRKSLVAWVSGPEFR